MEGVLLADVEVGKPVYLARMARDGELVDGIFTSSRVASVAQGGFTAASSIYRVKLIGWEPGEFARLAHVVQVVPEGLAGELVGGGRQQARQDGVMVPMGQLSLAGGVGGAVDGGQQQVLADREALVALGDLGVDEFDQADFAGLVEEGGDIAEAGQARGLGPEGLLCLGDGLDYMVLGAEIDGFDDGRFAVHALALAGVVIGASLEDFGGQGGHDG
jgi:hypothetical protein